jgi:hypothetical protein
MWRRKGFWSLLVTVVYIAFGNENFFREVLFSYLNLRHVMPGDNYQVVVYTDNPRWFAGYPGLRLESLIKERLNEWIGVAGFVYRCKILALRDCMDKYPGSRLLFLDGDTFLNADPSPVLSQLSPQTAMMNFPEAGRVIGLLKDVCELVVRKSPDLWELLGLTGVQDTWRMWNSGAIGLHSSHRPLLDQILYVNDLLYYRSCCRLIEQTAHSIVLGGRCNLVPLDREVVHYFAMKDGMRTALKRFFEENCRKPFDELVARAADFRPAMTHDPRLRGMDKLNNSIKKRKEKLAHRFRKLIRRKEWRAEIDRSKALALASLGAP